MTTAWYADLDGEADRKYPWQPVLVEVESGVVVTSATTWFATQPECVEFIVDNLVDVGLDEEA